MEIVEPCVKVNLMDEVAVIGFDDKSLLVTEIHGAIARLTINRAERRNAITLAMWHAIADHVEALGRADDARVLVISGAGADFSAGADISEFEAVRRDAGTARAYEEANSRAFASLRNAPFATIAAIKGICFGGGFGIAAACDIRIANPAARFAVPAAKLGLAYPHDAMLDIISTAGAQLIRYLVFTGSEMTAAAAKESGFLLETVDDNRLGRRIDEIAAMIAANAPLSVRATKAAIRAALTGEPGDIAHAKAAGDATFDSADYAEGRAAFKGRRKPNFTGK